MPEYLIQSPWSGARERRIHIASDDDFTAAQAMEFALKIIDAARAEGVTFTDQQGATP